MFFDIIIIMKKNNKAIIYLLTACIIGLTASCASTNTAQTEEHTNIENLISNQTLVFHADRLSAQNGFSKILTTDYNLKISPDTIQSWLPYYGRAYRATMDPSDGGIDFISTHFNYKVNENKKGGWTIEIHPQEAKINTRKMMLRVFSNGNADLSVISSYRQPINFYGKVKEK